MLATSAETLAFLAEVPKETWSAVGTGFGLFILAVAGTVASRRGAADKRAQPVSTPLPSPSPAGGVTFLADGDVEKAILGELRGIRGDLARWVEAADRRREAAERHSLEDENDDLRERVAALKAGQGVTHDNQGDIRSDIAALKDMIERLEVH